MEIAIGTKPVDGEAKDATGITWRYRVRPLLSADIATLRRVEVSGDVTTVREVSMAEAADLALVEILAAVGPDGLDVAVRVDGERHAATAPAVRGVVLRAVAELARGIVTDARAAGFKVEGERGN